MPFVQAIMPNDHVMCFKVWNELYSCLTHDHLYDQTDHDVSNYTQDDNDSSYHGYNDDITDDQQSLHNIQRSSPFTMDTIQQRLHYLLDPSEDKLSSASSDLYLANQETDHDHTSLEPDNIDKQNQVFHLRLFITVIVVAMTVGNSNRGRCYKNKMDTRSCRY